MSKQQLREREALEKRVKGLAETLLVYVDQLHAVMNLQHQDLAKMIGEARHDIKSPLSVMINACQIAKSREKEVVNAG